MKTRIIIKNLVMFILLITLCAAGFPVQNAQADETIGQVNVSDESTKPVITKLRNVYRGVKITWDKVDGASYYRVYRKSVYYDKVVEWEKLEDTEGLELLDTSALWDSTTYSYKVRAFDKNGNMSTNSKAKEIIRQSKPIYSKANVKAGIKLKPYSLKCTPTGIIVYRKAPGESSFARIAKVKGKYYTDTDVEEGKTYSYKVCTYISGSKSPVTKEITITYMGAPKLQLKKTDNGIKLSWTEVPGADGYEVLTSRYNNSYSTHHPYADVTGTTYVDKDEEHLNEAERGYKVCAYYYDGTRIVYGVPSSAKVIG